MKKIALETAIILLVIVLSFGVLITIAHAQSAITIDQAEGSAVKVSRRVTDRSAVVSVDVPLSVKVFVRGQEVTVNPGETVTLVIPAQSVLLPPGMTAEAYDTMMTRIKAMTDFTRDTRLCPDKVPVLVGPKP